MNIFVCMNMAKPQSKLRLWMNPCTASLGLLLDAPQILNLIRYEGGDPIWPKSEKCTIYLMSRYSQTKPWWFPSYMTELHVGFSEKTKLSWKNVLFFNCQKTHTLTLKFILQSWWKFDRILLARFELNHRDKFIDCYGINTSYIARTMGQSL